MRSNGANEQQKYHVGYFRVRLPFIKQKQNTLTSIYSRILFCCYAYSRAWSENYFQSRSFAVLLMVWGAMRCGTRVIRACMCSLCLFCSGELWTFYLLIELKLKLIPMVTEPLLCHLYSLTYCSCSWMSLLFHTWHEKRGRHEWQKERERSVPHVVHRVNSLD